MIHPAKLTGLATKLAVRGADMDATGVFRPSWGPAAAVCWAVIIYIGSVFVAAALSDLGLVAARLPDRTFDTEALLHMALPLQIAGLLAVASCLRRNPIDVMALRLPKRPAEAICIALAISVVFFVSAFLVLTLQENFVDAGGQVPEDHNQKSNEQAFARHSLLSNLLFSGVVTPVNEEMMFRGLLLFSFFPSRLWFWSAATLTSVLFALMHNSDSLNLFLHAPYILLGLSCAAGLRFTGSLWVPIGLHSLKNTIAAVALS
jgi:membrane protease YdiL (CAAX protease family)